MFIKCCRIRDQNHQFKRFSSPTAFILCSKWNSGAICENRLLTPTISTMSNTISNLPVHNLLKSPNRMQRSVAFNLVGYCFSYGSPDLQIYDFPWGLHEGKEGRILGMDLNLHQEHWKVKVISLKVMSMIHGPSSNLTLPPSHITNEIFAGETLQIWQVSS